MIWRLAHPVRAMVAFVLALTLIPTLFAALFGGFGIGMPELAAILAIALASAVLANRDWSPAGSRA